MERLHMNYLRDIIRRLQMGESERRIARDLDVSRPTVHKYRLLATEQGYLEPGADLPDEETLLAALGPGPQPPRIPSTLEPHRDTIQGLLEQGVEMTAMWQRLRENQGYTGSYSAVRRFVRQLCGSEPPAVIRVHTAPGEEMQVDFGSAGQFFDPVKGSPHLAYVFVATLSYSRHQYAELVFDQKVPTWIALHRHAFESFGGVPRRVVPDNLKAAVKKALILDPVLGEAYRQLALHYGCLLSPTAPRTPQHKGKVENGIHYVKRNFLAGQEFLDIRAANRQLQHWVQEVAGVRDHGTTHQAPLRLFQEYERQALLPLPADPFTLREIKPATVHRDCHLTIDGSYYSVPYQYVGQKLDVYVGERVVEIFRGQDLVTTHLRSQQRGHWSTRLEHYPPHKADYLRRTPPHCRQVAARLGPATSQVVDVLLSERPLDRLRSVQAILRLEETVGSQRLEAACARALYFGDPRYRRIKDILNVALDREPLPDTEPSEPRQSFAFARSGAEFFPPSRSDSLSDPDVHSQPDSQVEEATS